MAVAGVAAVAGGDGGDAGGAERADSGGAQRSHDLGSGAGADLRSVVVVGDVPDPVGLVLDRPVAADPRSELFGFGLVHAEVGDGVDSLGRAALRLVEAAPRRRICSACRVFAEKQS